MDRGQEEEDGIYADFVVTAKKAKASAEMRAISVIRKAFSGYNVKTVKTVTKPDGSFETTVTTGREFHWQAAAWWLERRNPDRWGKKDRVEVSQAKAPAGFVFKEVTGSEVPDLELKKREFEIALSL